MLLFVEEIACFKWSFSTIIFFLFFLNTCNKADGAKANVNVGELPLFGRPKRVDPEFRKKINVSQTEYSKQLVQFLNNNDLTKNVLIFSMVHSELDPEGYVVVFDPREVIGINNTILDAVVKMLLPPVNDDASLELTITVVDITRESVRSFVVGHQVIHLSKNETKWVEFRVTNSLIRFIQVVLVRRWHLLFQGLHLTPKEAYLNTVVKVDTPPPRQKRSPAEKYLTVGEFDAISRTSTDYEYYQRHDLTKDCTYTDEMQKSGSITCCRLEVPLSLKNMETENMLELLWHIVAPDELVFSLCQGKCGTLMYPVDILTNYTALHHAIVSTTAEMCRNGPVDTSTVEDVPNLCCAPTMYKSINILSNNFDDPTTLQATTVENAFATRCGCV